MLTLMCYIWFLMLLYIISGPVCKVSVYLDILGTTTAEYT